MFEAGFGGCDEGKRWLMVGTMLDELVPLGGNGGGGNIKMPFLGKGGAGGRAGTPAGM